MIQIIDKHNCCGCTACVQICPKHCIDFREDNKGFSYPFVNHEKCVNCGLCEQVCPCLNEGISRKPLKTYAVINPNIDVRMKSSSGGFFSMLAEYVIKKGGVVFGACYDENWNVIHDYTETLDGIIKFRGSKYVQSFIGESYVIARRFLQEGRLVLFTGTSCQIAGLKRFLKKDYNNLLSVDVVCHGVPSPLVWRSYLDYIKRPKGVDGKNTVSLSLKENLVITGISFRDKRTGWKKYGFVAYQKSAVKADKNSVLSHNKLGKEILLHEVHNENLYMKIFLNNLNLRPSCYKCHSKNGKCGSDFTIADFWGISEYKKMIDDDRGVSAVLVNSSKAYDIILQLNVETIEFQYKQVYKRNHSLEHSVKETKYSEMFWDVFKKEGIEHCNRIIDQIKPSLLQNIYSKVIKIIKHIGLK